MSSPSPQNSPPTNLPDLKPGQGSITVAEDPGSEAVMALFDLEGAGLALLKTGFDAEELIERMVAHVRDADPKVAMPATRQLLSHLKTLATLQGRIGRTTLTQEQKNDSGTVLKSSTHGETLRHKLIGSRPGSQPSTVGREFLAPTLSHTPPAPFPCEPEPPLAPLQDLPESGPPP